jgi:aryl-alcohol dehydrogenase-like predicted oxidoreductase
MKTFAQFALTATFHKLSGLGFGCMSITPPFSMYGPPPLTTTQSLDLLDTVYHEGCRHFDTAEGYQTEGYPHNEEILGQFFQTIPRDSYSVATKYWPVEGKHDYDSVKAALLRSLKRLSLDYVDLYYAHRIKSLEGGLEFARAAARLKQEGLIKEIGLCEVCPSWLREIHTQAGPIDAVQFEWNLLVRNIEGEIVPLCRELDIDIVVYSPLAKNSLASPQLVPDSDWRKDLPLYAPENIQQNQKVVDELHRLAEVKGCSTAQLSLAWLLRQGDEYGVTVVPIPGSAKREHVLDNLKAAQLELSKEDMQVLNGLAAQVVGARAPESYLKNTFEAQN